MRATIAALPDGTYEFYDFLDNDGITKKKLPIRVELTIDHDEAVADFSKSADQVRSPLNTVESGGDLRHHLRLPVSDG
jgi:N-methylhydantoinase B